MWAKFNVCDLVIFSGNYLRQYACAYAKCSLSVSC